jgi:hypothetical protein
MKNEKVNFGSAEKGRNTIVCGFKQIRFKCYYIIGK